MICWRCSDRQSWAGGYRISAVHLSLSRLHVLSCKCIDKTPRVDGESRETSCINYAYSSIQIYLISPFLTSVYNSHIYTDQSGNEMKFLAKVKRYQVINTWRATHGRPLCKDCDTG